MFGFRKDKKVMKKKEKNATFILNTTYIFKFTPYRQPFIYQLFRLLKNLYFHSKRRTRHFIRITL